MLCVLGLVWSVRLYGEKLDTFVEIIKLLDVCIVMLEP